MKKTVMALAALLVGGFAFSGQALALDEAKAKEFVQAKMSAWMNDPVVVEAIKAQNEAHASMTQEQIDAADAQWKANEGDLRAKVNATEASTKLKAVQAESGGLFSEIFVMDNKGLNVAQSAETSDYWQGDEDKWQKSFGAGVGAVHVGEVEFDESSQTFQVQISATISDGGAAIGAVTVGANADMLK